MTGLEKILACSMQWLARHYPQQHTKVSEDTSHYSMKG